MIGLTHLHDYHWNQLISIVNIINGDCDCDNGDEDNFDVFSRDIIGLVQCLYC